MKTFFEELSEACDSGLELEQSLRYCIKMKSQYQTLPSFSPLAIHKTAVFTRYEKMLNNALLRHKKEIINKLIEKI